MTSQIVLNSRYDDANIFHFFAVEIRAIWEVLEKNPTRKYAVYLHKYTDNNPVHEWRRDLLRALLPVYTYPADVPTTIKEYEELKTSSWIIDPWKFVNYRPDPHYIRMASIIKQYYNTHKTKGSQVVYITRNTSRILYDHKEKIRFDDLFEAYCKKHNIPYTMVSFDNCSFTKQAEIVATAKVMLSCHGACNTNIFLLPENGHLIEINFRRHWYCDPVCDDHFNDVIPYDQECNGHLTFRPYFHKADYHNLALLFNKKYTELEFEDAKVFLDRNPINVAKIYVNSKNIMRTVEEAFKKN